MGRNTRVNTIPLRQLLSVCKYKHLACLFKEVATILKKRDTTGPSSPPPDCRGTTEVKLFKEKEGAAEEQRNQKT